MGVQACRLPPLKCLKPLKRFKTLKTLKTLLKTLKTLQTVQKLLGTPNRAAPRPHRLNILLACFILQPTGTPRPHINVYGRPSLPFASP